MSWKPALIGAVVVILAGFGVGLATGGDHSTGTRTMTGGRPGGSTARHSTDPDARVQYLASNSEPQSYNVDVAADTPAVVRVGRAHLENSVLLESIFLIDCAENGTVEYPVDSATASFAGTLGWTIDSDSYASVTLEIHADRADGPRLYRKTFEGPDDVNVRVPLRGAYKAVFVFIVPSDCDNADDLTSDETFALGDARFVG